MKVVVDVGKKPAFWVVYFVHRISVFGSVVGFALAVAADYKRHDVFGLDMLAFCEKFETDLDCRHTTTVWVVLWIFTELSEDGVLVDRNALLSHLSCQIAKVVVDLTDYSVRVLAREKKVEQVPKTR